MKFGLLPNVLIRTKVHYLLPPIRLYLNYPMYTIWRDHLANQTKVKHNHQFTCLEQ